MNSDSGINKVLLIGEISRSPRWHKVGYGAHMLCFTLTTRNTYLQKGKTAERAEDHAIKIPEKLFEQDLKLGQLVHIEGNCKPPYL